MGVDASLTSTGIAYMVDGAPFTASLKTGDLRGAHRLAYIRNQVVKHLSICKPTTVVFEDYAMGKGGKGNPGRVFHIGELGGVLKLLLWEHGIDVLLVGPTTMKAIIANNGHAKKPQVIKALSDSFGFRIPAHDEADALALMLVGEIRCGKTKHPLAKARIESLAKCELIKGQLKLISTQQTQN